MDWSIKIPSKPVKLPAKGKYVIFSDLHRDKFHNKAGNFWYNRDLYKDALNFYLKKGYTLIENGDGEELWQFSLKEILSSHDEIYKLFAEFYKEDRAYFLYGNHNVDMKFRIFHSYWTDKYMPKVKYHPLLFIGDHIMVTHGHQWDWVYRLGFIPVRLIVRLWKYLEYLGVGSFDPSIPSEHSDLARKIDRNIIEWGNDHGYIMICGHTHYAKFHPGGDYYYNSGCGVVEGRLTGLEISNGNIKLIRWMADYDGVHKREVLSEMRLPKNREDFKRILRMKESKPEERKIITVFGASAPRTGDEEYKLAEELGKAIAKMGYALRNGGYGGTMEASARGARSEEGDVIGVLMSKSQWGKGNKFSTERVYAENIFDRINKLINNSSAFVVLPGSSGTLAEISLLIELINKNFINRIPVIFIGDFWKKQVEIFDKTTKNLRGAISMVDTLEECMDLLAKNVR